MLFLAALLLAVQAASAQTAKVPGAPGKAQDAGAAATAPTLPEPLTRQAIRDVLSGLSDGQARELLLRELDRQVAAREAALAVVEAEERTLGALLGDWAVALGRGWVDVVRDVPSIPGNAAATLGGFQAERGDATAWRVPGTLILCLLAGLAAALGARRLVRDTETRLDRLRPAGLWSQIGIVTGRFLVQGAQLIALPRRRVCRRCPRQPRHTRGRRGGPACGPVAGLDLARGDGRPLRAGADTPAPAAVRGR